MTKEIELKFKIDQIPSSCKDYVLIHQYYFNYFHRKKILEQEFTDLHLDKIKEGRVRMIYKNDKVQFILTLKSGELLNREEYEKPIDEKLATLLLKDNTLGCIQKKRYKECAQNITFEFDEYLNLNANLNTAEVELKDEATEEVVNQVENILKNEFHLKIKNVTNNDAFKNKNLAIMGGYDYDSDRE